MGTMAPAGLAKAAGLRPQMISKYLAGTMPGADKAVLIAQALDVPVEWLVTGRTPRAAHSLIAAEEADWVMLPHYRLSEFTESAKPEPIETIPIRRDWLNQNARVASNLWLTDLPSTVEGIGEEGDPILCRDAETHYQEGFYLYFFDGMPIVRKVSGPVFGQLADAQRPRSFQGDDNLGLRLVARVLGTFKMRSV